MDHGIVDSTIVRAQPCATGAEKKGRPTSRHWAAAVVASVPRLTSSSMGWASLCRLVVASEVVGASRAACYAAPTGRGRRRALVPPLPAARRYDVPIRCTLQLGRP